MTTTTAQSTLTRSKVAISMLMKAVTIAPVIKIFLIANILTIIMVAIKAQIYTI